MSTEETGQTMIMPRRMVSEYPRIFPRRLYLGASTPVTSDVGVDDGMGQKPAPCSQLLRNSLPLFTQRQMGLNRLMTRVNITLPFHPPLSQETHLHVTALVPPFRLRLMPPNSF